MEDSTPPIHFVKITYRVNAQGRDEALKLGKLAAICRNHSPTELISHDECVRLIDTQVRPEPQDMNGQAPTTPSGAWLVEIIHLRPWDAESFNLVMSCAYLEAMPHEKPDIQLNKTPWKAIAHAIDEQTGIDQCLASPGPPRSKDKPRL